MLKVFFRIFDFILFSGFFIQSKTRGTRISENPVIGGKIAVTFKLSHDNIVSKAEQSHYILDW